MPKNTQKALNYNSIHLSHWALLFNGKPETEGRRPVEAVLPIEFRVKLTKWKGETTSHFEALSMCYPEKS
jgi:hypothetical protein